MQLSKWDDGFRIDTDPRREDPLFYYRRGEEWSSAIGVQVDPAYEEHQAAEVVVRVFPQHKALLAHFSDEEVEVLYGRIVKSLLKEYPNWLVVKVEFPYTASVTQAFCTAGFTMSEDANVKWQHWHRP